MINFLIIALDILHLLELLGKRKQLLMREEYIMLGESMRKNIFLLILLFFVFALALFGCKQESNNNNPEDNKPVLSVSINYFELLAGESATITPTVTGVKEELVVLFSSENPAVATVDETGVIEAMAPGETTIILIIENYEDIIETIT
ncbi:MAG: Ig-like domain-containing protein, partial [Endomicrobiaceae bacterium]|nr:Ig-like domain-containing protein [Endomicrobiaceae bacterium]